MNFHAWNHSKVTSNYHDRFLVVVHPRFKYLRDKRCVVAAHFLLPLDCIIYIAGKVDRTAVNGVVAPRVGYLCIWCVRVRNEENDRRKETPGKNGE